MVFHFAAVELWNFLNVLAETLDYGGCEACGTGLRLSNCINEPVSGLGSLLYICCSNAESGETNISGKIRPTVTPEPREGDQSLM